MEINETKEAEAAIEGILFASGEPVDISRICVALDMDRDTVQTILSRLEDYYAYERRGIRLVQMDSQYQLVSSPDHAEVIRRAFEIRKPAKLSQPALEVLTIIAYYQPTTRAYVDQIRGVDSSYTVGLLLDRRLIEECGRLQVPGRPRLYRTTKEFLRAFHLSSLDELPAMPGIEQDGQMRLGDDGQIVEPSTPRSGGQEDDSGADAPEDASEDTPEDAPEETTDTEEDQ
jgi:segregation and condensation protein B